MGKQTLARMQRNHNNSGLFGGGELGMDAKAEALEAPRHDAPVAARVRKCRSRQASGAGHDNAVDRLTARLSQDRFVRLGLLFLEGLRDIHLKELVLEEMDIIANRVQGQTRSTSAPTVSSAWIAIRTSNGR